MIRTSDRTAVFLLATLLVPMGALTACEQGGAPPHHEETSGPPDSEQDALQEGPENPPLKGPAERASADTMESDPLSPPTSEAEAAAVENAAAPAKKERVTQEPHSGPFLWVTRSSAAIYREPREDRKAKLGYVKRGGQVPIEDSKVQGEGCPRGWYHVPTGGYICSHVGTTDKNAREVKYRPNQPNLAEILPYPYARNRENGTPLYKTVPTKEQTLVYEPYLPEAQKLRELEEEKKEAERTRREELAKRMEEDRRQMEEAGLEFEMAELPIAVGAGGGATAPGGENTGGASDIPLWEREENLHEVKLDDLRKESDDILAARMMKGFYVAIDRTIKWDGRTWYKTTKGLITPADRFYQTAGSEFHGVELDGSEWSLPVGWVVGPRDETSTYQIDTETNQRVAKGKKEKFEAIALQYRYHRIADVDYFQTKDGDWIRDAHVRMTTPGARPPEVGEHERWVDVDISEQTLVVFEGDRPVYATLISSGKHSNDKAKDHSTPLGMWRVREKHMVSTMDGDGTAAGDLPYSIEDVPYIMYFHKAYATHGAFWHRNYGYQMSHGCVNLAPLDAKWIFFYSDPPVPEGFHGVWSNEDNLGSMVVVHE